MRGRQGEGLSAEGIARQVGGVSDRDPPARAGRDAHHEVGPGPVDQGAVVALPGRGRGDISVVPGREGVAQEAERATHGLDAARIGRFRDQAGEAAEIAVAGGDRGGHHALAGRDVERDRVPGSLADRRQQESLTSSVAFSERVNDVEIVEQLGSAGDEGRPVEIHQRAAVVDRPEGDACHGGDHGWAGEGGELRVRACICPVGLLDADRAGPAGPFVDRAEQPVMNILQRVEGEGRLRQVILQLGVGKGCTLVLSALERLGIAKAELVLESLRAWVEIGISVRGHAGRQYGRLPYRRR